MKNVCEHYILRQFLGMKVKQDILVLVNKHTYTTNQ